MSKVKEISRESWILNTFPEWGTWINEEIEAEVVEKNKVAMWWLGNMGTWVKTESDANICIDLWLSTGKRTKSNPLMRPKHQHQRAIGCVKLQPNLRNTPCIIDPFKIKKIDAILATHSHSDHIDVNVAAAVVKNCPEAIFIGPKSCVDLWEKWGVPSDRIKCVRPGDSIKIKDMEIVMVESFDRTMLLTVANDDETLKGKMPPNMDDLAVNYIVKTPGGNIYHAGDSHYSNYYVKHARDHKIDIALVGYGENPRGMTDKLTSSDVLKVAESLDVEVIIPIHYDIWTNFMADPKEIQMLWNMRKYRMKYKFKPYIWQPGGKFIYPDNKDDMEYMFPRGFEDAFELEPDLPFLQIL